MRRQITLAEIGPGRSVFFESKYQDNYDLYWKVVQILPDNESIIVEINEMGHRDRTTVKIREVLLVEPQLS